MTNRFVRIDYRDFYDVPRIFIAHAPEADYLFDCPFDVDKDEYASDYAIFLMPVLRSEQLAGDWTDLRKQAIKPLGRIEVGNVRFDATKRQQADIGFLSRTISK